MDVKSILKSQKAFPCDECEEVDSEFVVRVGNKGVYLCEDCAAILCEQIQEKIVCGDK